MTTQNVHMKILHALRLKWKILIKCFTSYIKKCQMGTGWVYKVSSYISGKDLCPPTKKVPYTLAVQYV